MKTIYIDSHKIDIVRISSNFNRGRKLYHIYYDYNNGYSQTDFIIDIDSPSTTLYRIFTTRQLRILMNKLLRMEREEK